MGHSNLRWMTKARRMEWMNVSLPSNSFGLALTFPRSNLALRCCLQGRRRRWRCGCPIHNRSGSIYSGWCLCPSDRILALLWSFSRIDSESRTCWCASPGCTADSMYLWWYAGSLTFIPSTQAIFDSCHSGTTLGELLSALWMMLPSPFKSCRSIMRVQLSFTYLTQQEQISLWATIWTEKKERYETSILPFTIAVSN